jgi:hypothetical protein
LFSNTHTGASLENSKMSKQVGKRVAAATAVAGSLAKAQRQLLAATYEEAARRHAKSVQVTFTPKGVLKASVYLEWPTQVFREASEVMQDDAAEPVQMEHMEDAPIAPPHAQREAEVMDAAPAKPTVKAGVKFTVKDPAKAETKSKPMPDRKKSAAQVVSKVVDKNALSARGSAPKAGHTPTEGPRDAVPEPPAAAAPSWAVVAGRKKHGKKATVPRQIVAEPEPPPVGGPELKRERERKAGALSLFRASAERPSSDESDGSPPFKSPRGSEADSMAEDEVYSDRYSGYGSDY